MYTNLSPLQALVAVLSILDEPTPSQDARMAAIKLSWTKRHQPTHDYEWGVAVHHALLDGYLVEGDGDTWCRGRVLPVEVPPKWRESAREALILAKAFNAETTAEYLARVGAAR